MCFLKKIFPFLFFGVILLNTENVPAFAENLPETTAKGCVLTDAATGQIIYGKMKMKNFLWQAQQKL